MPLALPAKKVPVIHREVKTKSITRSPNSFEQTSPVGQVRPPCTFQKSICRPAPLTSNTRNSAKPRSEFAHILETEDQATQAASVGCFEPVLLQTLRMRHDTHLMDQWPSANTPGGDVVPLAGVELLCRLCIAMHKKTKNRRSVGHWGSTALLKLEPRSQGLSGLPAPPSSKPKPDIDAAISLYTFVSDL